MWTIGFRKDIYEAAGVEFKWPEGKFTSEKAQLDKMVDESNDPGTEVGDIPARNPNKKETTRASTRTPRTCPRRTKRGRTHMDQ